MSVRQRKWTDNDGRPQEAWMIDVDFRHPNGRRERIKRFSPVNTRRGAERCELEVRHALLHGTFEREVKEERTPTLSEFQTRFLEYSENNNKFSTMVSKRQALEHHILPAFGDTRLDRIDLAAIEGFKAQMRKKLSTARTRKPDATRWAVAKRYGDIPKPLSLKTVNNVLGILRRILSLAHEQGLLKSVPRVKFFKVDKGTFDFLDFDEAERLLEAADPEWHTLILLALKTGLRQGELIGLKWEDIDLVREQLHVRRAIWRGVMGTPKGGRARTLDLPASVVASLKAHRHLRGPFVFCQANGNPLTAGKMKAPLTRALRRAGISRPLGLVGWHDLRHTFASHLVMRGVALKAVQELLGHADITMTMKYAHLSPGAKRSAVQLLDQPAPNLEPAPLTATPTAHERNMGASLQ